MAEYIERTEELILAVNAGARAIEHTKKYHGASYCIDVFAENPREIPYLKAVEVLRGFDEIPAADVVPVVHGRWMDGECGTFCTNCNRVFDEDFEIRREVCKKLLRCPNCGAHMKDGE